jgi:hypothetical protein
MVVLLVFVIVPFLIDSLTEPNQVEQSAGFRPRRLIRRVSENEVIAEFLKTDFETPAFRQYQEALHKIVARPNIEDTVENEKRRALFFIRHHALWNELPGQLLGQQNDLSPGAIAGDRRSDKLLPLRR